MLETTQGDPATALCVGEVLAALATPSGQSDPYPHYARLRELAPAAVGSDGTLVATGYAECAALLRDHRLVKMPGRALTAAGFPDWRERPSLAMLYGSMLMLNPPDHTRLRRLVSGAFTARRVAALQPAIERIVADLLDEIEGRSDFLSSFAFPLPVTVIGELLGVPAADRAMFQDLVREWTKVLEILSPLAVDAADVAAMAMREYFLALADERSARPADDLLSALVAARAVDDGLTDDEIVAVAALLLGAGFETTTGLLANGLIALLAHPDQAARLRVEPALATSAVDELLRFDTPVQMLFGRASAEAVEIAGVPLTVGQRVTTIVGAANRDPRVFSEPDTLRLDRTQGAPLSFGGGIHYCLGAPLARLEAAAAFPALLRRFPSLGLDGEPVRRPGLTIRGYLSVPIATD